ncbi:MAG: ribosomal-protein-alanine N-acetyltransferase [archaeon GW2011_AR5]|nr:MAG: ribosomal-protein-alanine N-acetyltransferase [archaeon GW2011_AR5]
MKTRLATAKDSEEVAAIIKRHAQDDYMGYATFNDTYIKDKMKKNNFFFVAEDSDKIVGCIRASIVDLDLAEIRTLCVDEGYRKKGLATELLQEALKLLREKKMRKVAARSKADNTEVIRLFEKAGFEKEGYFREHYRKGIDIIQMGKFL